MFAAMDDALARLYPTRTWGRRDELAAFDGGIDAQEGQGLADAIAKRLGTFAAFRPGQATEWCDYIYVLCLGRPPCIFELREQAASREPLSPGDIDDNLDERYLRVALSSVARFATVQEVAMTVAREGDAFVFTERPRTGVFDPVLLRRLQMLVAVLVESGIRHLDFGELISTPEGFDGSEYRKLFGEDPLLANYLFSPQPPASVTTVIVPAP